MVFWWLSKWVAVIFFVAFFELAVARRFFFCLRCLSDEFKPLIITHNDILDVNGTFFVTFN